MALVIYNMSTHYRHFIGILKSIIFCTKSDGYTGQEVFGTERLKPRAGHEPLRKQRVGLSPWAELLAIYESL